MFRRRRVHDTIVFFGSARIGEDGPLGEYYAAARELARLVTSGPTGLRAPRTAIWCAPAAAPGSWRPPTAERGDAAEGPIGLNIGLPHEQRPNAFISAGLSSPSGVD